MSIERAFPVVFHMADMGNESRSNHNFINLMKDAIPLVEPVLGSVPLWFRCSLQSAFSHLF
jgi:hypothetical protein